MRAWVKSSVGRSETETAYVSCQQATSWPLEPQEPHGCTSWMKLLQPIQLSGQVRGVCASWLHVVPPGVQLCDLWLTQEMTVALSYKGWRRVEEVVGGLRSLWIAAKADWQEKNFLPTLPTACVFSFHPLKVKGSWAFTTAMCLPREVAVNGDKVLLKEQDFHAAPWIKPAWHRASLGSFLKQRVQWSLLICLGENCTEG